MAIWRCAAGGYHNGQDCAVEFKNLLKHTTSKHDIQMVRVVERDELLLYLTRKGITDILPAQVDEILEAIVELTPDSKGAWEHLFKDSK